MNLLSCLTATVLLVFTDVSLRYQAAHADIASTSVATTSQLPSGINSVPQDSDPKPLLLFNVEGIGHRPGDVPTADTILYDNGLVIYDAYDPIRRDHNRDGINYEPVSDFYRCITLTPRELSNLLVRAHYNDLAALNTMYCVSDWPHYCLTFWKDGVRRTLTVGGNIYGEGVFENGAEPAAPSSPAFCIHADAETSRKRVPATVLQALDTMRYYGNKRAKIYPANKYEVQFHLAQGHITNILGWPSNYPEADLPATPPVDTEGYASPLDLSDYTAIRKSIALNKAKSAYSINGNLWQVELDEKCVLPSQAMWADIP